jgi:hypothetical protein
VTFQNSNDIPPNSSLTNFKNLYKFFLVEEMNKAELVSRIAELAGVTKVQTEKGLDALIQAITEANRSSRERRSCKTCRIGLI